MMRGTFRQKLRNNWAALTVCAVTAASATAVVLAKSCGNKMPCKRPPITEPIVRNDGLCMEIEGYPYLRNKDLTIMKDKNGKPVPNPYYSKGDCYMGDNECDTAKTVNELRNAAHQPLDLKNLIIKDNKTIMTLDGRTITLPLEDENSYDCQIARVRKDPCSDAPDAPKINRPLMTKIDPRTPQVQRDQSFLEKVGKKKSLLQHGSNYTITVPNGYRESEVCTKTLPVCDPNYHVPCRCPNHDSCVPATCGNGYIDTIKKKVGKKTVTWTEECDPKHDKRRYRVRRGYYCSPVTCKWVKRQRRKPDQECGNNVREGTEECDGRDKSRCGTNGTCTSSCKCKSGPPPQTCGNNKREGTEECDGRDRSRCGSDSICNSSCRCEKKKPPKQLSRCQRDSSVTAVIRSIRRYTNGRALNFSKKYQHTAVSTVRVYVKLIMGGNGRGQSYTVTSSCTGTTCARNRLSSSENRAAFGNLNVGMLKITPQGDKCYISITNKVAPGGS